MTTPEVYCENCGALMNIEWSKEGDVDCILAHRCSCEKITTCWYKTSNDSEWKTGFFHQWSQNYEEFESGPGNFPAAIIEDATNSQVHVVHAGWVSFSPDSPDSPDAPEEGDPRIPSLDMSEMVTDDDGWYGKAAAAAAEKPGAPEKPKRFVPRLAWVAHTYHWVIQVHPDAIEVFNDEADHLCQVRWIDGAMDYSQGGLPLAAMRDMFEEAACEVAHQEGRSQPLQDFIDNLKESNK